jgi:hypothetical protein
VGFYEIGNESSPSIKGRKFFDELITFSSLRTLFHVVTSVDVFSCTSTMVSTSNVSLCEVCLTVSDQCELRKNRNICGWC